MSSKMNKTAYKELIEADISFLSILPQTLEIRHIIAILNRSVELEYGSVPAETVVMPSNTEDENKAVGGGKLERFITLYQKRLDYYLNNYKREDRDGYIQLHREFIGNLKALR